MKKILRFIPIVILLTAMMFVVSMALAVGPQGKGYPAPIGFVNDFASVLTQNFKVKLEGQLTSLRDQTTNEVSVVTVETVSPEPIENYSIHLADAWKPGVKGKDNGVIMLFAMKDREMRIEVGRGLEGDLTDSEAKHIINDITPRFKAGDYDGGVQVGVNGVIAQIAPQLVATAAAVMAPAVTSDGTAVLVVIAIIVIAFIIVAAVSYSPYTPLGGQGTTGFTRRSSLLDTVWYPTPGAGFFSSTSRPSSSSYRSSSSSSSSGFGGFSGGSFSGGGASGKW